MDQTITTAAHEETFDGKGGLKIFFRSWTPPAPRAVLVICHGVNAHSGQYVWPAEQFAAAGNAVYALDLRGRGKSEGERFYVETSPTMSATLPSMIEIAKSREPGLPVFLLGHSAGGVVSCVYTLDNQDEIAGFICESFAFQIPAPGFALAAIKGLGRVAPHLPVLKLQEQGLFPRSKGGRSAEGRSADRRRETAGDTVAALVRAASACTTRSRHHHSGAHPARHRRQGDRLPGSQFFFKRSAPRTRR